MTRQEEVFNDEERLWLKEQLLREDVKAILESQDARKCKRAATLIWAAYKEKFSLPFPEEDQVAYDIRWSNAALSRRPLLTPHPAETPEEAQSRLTKRLGVRRLDLSCGIADAASANPRMGQGQLQAVL